MRKNREEVLAEILKNPHFPSLSIKVMGSAIHLIDLEISAMDKVSEKEKFKELLHQRKLISEANMSSKFFLRIFPKTLHSRLPGKRVPDGKGGFFNTFFG